ncbi:EamA family transporter [Pseudomonas asiatica]|uniref:EamA family transporter n=1 Tax=Pseudomonas asiatica TaxID=2219225 RepID=UPI003877CC77
MQLPYFPRHLSILILAGLSFVFASNHVAARIAFDNGVGLLMALLCRSGGACLVLGLLIKAKSIPVALDAQTLRWQLLAGALIGVQSYCLYSAVALIPVGIALLVFNLSPVVLIFINWATGGGAPTQRTAMITAVILMGLVLVLNLPGVFAGRYPVTYDTMKGLCLSLSSAVLFAAALWVTDKKLNRVAGVVRSMLTMALVFIIAAVLGLSGLLQGAVRLPANTTGLLALISLAALYGSGFSILFGLMSRLEITRHAPVMNVEPVAGLVMGWLVLGQQLALIQWVGGACVVFGVMALAWRPGR